MLHQSKFGYAHFPELVDLAVVGCGLGALRSNLSFVNNKGNYWDTTQWDVAPRPFLDTQGLAYASAIAAWIRGDKHPQWADDLPKDVKRLMQKSLKYLHKTNDSFFQPASGAPNALDQSQDRWWELAASQSASTQIVAIRQLQLNEALTDPQQTLLVNLLRSSNRAMLLHTIDATGEMREAAEPIVDELRLLVEHRDNEVCAKAVYSLTKLAKLDEATTRLAAGMLDSKVRFVAFAGIVSLASQDSVSSHNMLAVDRGFVRALQNCDYEFIGLFAAAYQRWLDDPKAHFESLLRDDAPEFLEVAIESLENVREQLVALGNA